MSRVTPRWRTQGNWSLDERPVMYGAGSSPSRPEYYLVAVNDLYGDGGDVFIEGLIAAGHRVLLDSGIFNLTNEHKRATGCTMDEALSLAPDEITGFDRLFDRYVELAKRWGDQLWGYIELDQGGAVNKRKTRARLHDLGLDPIPVYHPLNDGWEYFDELASEHARMCLGNIVQADAPTRLRLLHTLWERHRAYPDLWVHVLGLTLNETCLPFAPDSCDSSTWLSGLRWPAVCLGATSLGRLGYNTDPAFRYDTTLDGQGGNNTDITLNRFDRPLTTDRFAASGMYADELEFSTLQWRAIETDRAAELGEVIRPAYDDREGELCPSRKP